MPAQTIEITLRTNILKLGMLLNCMQFFSIQLIAHGARGGSLDQERIASIQKEVLAQLKGTSISGLSDIEKVEFFKSCDAALRTLLSAVTDEGLKKGQISDPRH